MNSHVSGLHHITALTADAQKNIDFYTGVLGLRLVKKTINFDAPDVYHLYYGNETGSPGTLLTFFPFPGLPKGRKGTGQLTVTSFSVPENSLSYWMRRFDKFKVNYKQPKTRFEELVLYFEDFDGLGLELVENQVDPRPGFTYGNISLEFAIRGIYGITLSEECYERTENLLVYQMGHKLMAEKENRFRFSTSGKPGEFVDIVCNPDALKGLGGAGTVHHVAFATADASTQLEARNALLKYGLNVTPVLNREYFLSIYFREPGGVLFEIATISPGFTIDEPLESLGESLKLPSWEEKNRESIECYLPPIQMNLHLYSA